MAEYGILNEVGDLGLGFTPLNKKNNQAINENNNTSEKSNNDKDKKEEKY